MPLSRKLRIIIPAYNEVQRIGATLNDYCSAFSGFGTILVVANGCSDGTAKLVRSLQSAYDNLELIEIAGKIGKGGAVRAGLWTGDEPFVGFVDADGSTAAAEFLRLFERLQCRSIDGVIGSRWLPQSHVEPQQPLLRRVASRTFNGIVRVLFGLPFCDTQCGAKIFTRRAIAEIFHSLEVANFAFDIEVLWLLQRNGFRIEEAPTTWADRQAGTKVRVIPTSLSMLKTVFRMRLRQSVLWLLPFIDRLGHKSIIPVVDAHRILLLGGSIDELSHDHALSELFAHLEILGYQLIEAEAVTAGNLFGTLRRIIWYLFQSNRDYEAIIEICGPTLSWIPWFSLKPSFVVSTVCHPNAQQRKAVYQRSAFIDLDEQTPAEAANTIVLLQSGAALYNAVFYKTADTVSIHCPTVDGPWERQILQR